MNDIQPRLWCITYQVEENTMNVFTVGVDMDERTAERLAVEQERAYIAQQNNDDFEELGKAYNLYDYNIWNVEFEAVPLTVDNHAVLVVPIEEVKDLCFVCREQPVVDGTELCTDDMKFADKEEV
jgi:hypothetical protein